MRDAIRGSGEPLKNPPKVVDLLKRGGDCRQCGYMQMYRTVTKWHPQCLRYPHRRLRYKRELPYTVVETGKSASVVQRADIELLSNPGCPDWRQRMSPLPREAFEKTEYVGAKDEES